MLYIFEKVLHRQIFWYQNVWGLYRKPKQNNFANTVGIKCLSNRTPHHNKKLVCNLLVNISWDNMLFWLYYHNVSVPKGNTIYILFFDTVAPDTYFII